LAYVVNPGGAVVDVTDEHAAELLTNKAWREATPEEAHDCADREAGVPPAVEVNESKSKDGDKA